MSRPTTDLKPFHAPGSQKKLLMRPWGREQLAQALNNLRLNGEIRKILDVGFGATMRSTLALSDCFPDADIIAIDNQFEALEVVHKYLQDGNCSPARNAKFYFGDPEFALPDIKVDLVVLSMVCHCFDYPYRALANLIENSLSENGKILFIHRTDPFMKAVCGFNDEEIQKDAAAKVVVDAWKTNNGYPDPCCRLISDHAPCLSHFMEEAGFRCIEQKNIELQNVKSELVKEVLAEKRYSPLDRFEGAVNIDCDGLSNKSVVLDMYLYACDGCDVSVIPEIARNIAPVGFHAGGLDIDDIRGIVNNEQGGKSNDSGQFAFKKITDWFVGEKAAFHKDVLKYGFYVDTRQDALQSYGNDRVTFNAFRSQLWPSNKVLNHEKPADSISLVEALANYANKEIEKYFQAIIWVSLPSLRFWLGSYTLFKGVFDFISDEQPRWKLLPYIGDENEEQQLIPVLMDGLGGKKADYDAWAKLALYLRTLADVLRKENITCTYYFTFRDSYSKDSEPIAFSFQSARWLNASEAQQLAVISQSALATINEGMSVLYRLDKEEYDQIRDRLSDLSSELHALQNVAANVERIQEIMDPDVVFRGTNALRDLGGYLSKSQLFAAGGEEHHPAGHKNNKKLRDLLLSGEGKEKYTLVKKDFEKDKDQVFKTILAQLFAPIENNEERREDNVDPLPSLCLAKDIERQRMPLSWIQIGLEANAQGNPPDEDTWRHYLDMRDTSACLRLLKALWLLGDQLNLSQVEIKYQSGDGIVVIFAKPEYHSEGYHRMAEVVASVVYGWEKEVPNGTLSKALYWLREGAFKLHLSGDIPVLMPDKVMGEIGIGAEQIWLRFRMTQYPNLNAIQGTTSGEF